MAKLTADRLKRRPVSDGDGTWVENQPGRLERVLGVLGEIAMRPVDAFWGLANSPEVKYMLPPTEEGAAQSLMAASPALLGNAPVSRLPAGLKPPKTLVSKSAKMYDPPSKPQRPISADYPNGAPVDEQGRITHDIEGRPLTARWVAGRRDLVSGAGRGDEQAFPAAELDALAKATTGRGIAFRPPGGMRPDVGHTAIDPRTGVPLSVSVSRGLPVADQARVATHELGHVVNATAGKMPVSGLMDELKPLYNSLNNPNRTRDGTDAASWGKPFTPESQGYSKKDAPLEYVAEAFRAYMTDPNYIKTVAPKTAKRIRDYVNAHPELSKIIQFNAIAGLTARAMTQSEQGVSEDKRLTAEKLKSRRPQ